MSKCRKGFGVEVKDKKVQIVIVMVVEVAALKVTSPLYVALIKRLPNPRLKVVSPACPLVALIVPRTVPPSKNVIVIVGTSPTLDPTPALSDTCSPRAAS